MLVLSRKKGEQIKIGQYITITVLWIAPSRSRVRLGIEDKTPQGFPRNEIRRVTDKGHEDG